MKKSYQINVFLFYALLYLSSINASGTDYNGRGNVTPDSVAVEMEDLTDNISAACNRTPNIIDIPNDLATDDLLEIITRTGNESITEQPQNENALRGVGLLGAVGFVAMITLTFSIKHPNSNSPVDL